MVSRTSGRLIVSTAGSDAGPALPPSVATTRLTAAGAPSGIVATHLHDADPVVAVDERTAKLMQPGMPAGARSLKNVTVAFLMSPGLTVTVAVDVIVAALVVGFFVVHFDAPVYTIAPVADHLEMTMFAVARPEPLLASPGVTTRSS